MAFFNTKSVLGLTISSAILVAFYTISDNVSFASLDTDNSGYISADESKRNTALFSTFTDADLNRDGVISVVEFNYTMIR